jgi:hypothetical protein
MQLAAPEVPLYDPAAQGRQAAGPLEKNPAGQAVRLQDGAPATLNKPAAQGAQVEEELAPTAGLNVPAGQGVAFTEERGQKKPTGQITGAPEAQK